MLFQKHTRSKQSLKCVHFFRLNFRNNKKLKKTQIRYKLCHGPERKIMKENNVFKITFNSQKFKMFGQICVSKFY